MGCVMMRVCHLNTCPVGVATQNPSCARRFSGKPEHVVNFFAFIAEEVRELMAELGFRTLDEMVGRVEMLDVRRPSITGRRKGSTSRRSSTARRRPAPGRGTRTPPRRRRTTARQGLDHAAPRALRAGDRAGEPGEARPADPQREPHRRHHLGHEVTKRYGGAGLPDDTIDSTSRARPGQSFGAFVPRASRSARGRRQRLRRQGPVGRRIVVVPAPDRDLRARGQHHRRQRRAVRRDRRRAFLRGVAGERFCVRNSGATPSSRAWATTAAST
jgi:glutamate synthase (NADPH/NADH) large chain